MTRLHSAYLTVKYPLMSGMGHEESSRISQDRGFASDGSTSRKYPSFVSPYRVSRYAGMHVMVFGEPVLVILPVITILPYAPLPLQLNVLLPLRQFTASWQQTFRSPRLTARFRNATFPSPATTTRQQLKHDRHKLDYPAA
jgi:hypothetical protein